MPEDQTAVAVSIPKITICMPVYNVEPYLRKSLQSVLDQTFPDFLLLAVDDGSTDHCLEILQEFAKKDARIKVIHQENQGVAVARNVALSRAQSEYICFLDSDDCLAPTFLQEMYEAAQTNRADIVYCYFHYCFTNPDRKYQYPFRCHGVLDSEKALKKLLIDIRLQSFSWNKLFKRSLFADHQISFPPSMAFEDLATLHRVFFHANKIVVLNRSLYQYNRYPSSTISNMSVKIINDLIRAMGMIRISLTQEGVYPTYKKSFRLLCLKSNFFCGVYLIRIAKKQHSLKGMLSNFWKCTQTLRHYRSKSFASDGHAPSIRDAMQLPDVLPQESAVEQI